jgi:hypothetical protein
MSIDWQAFTPRTAVAGGLLIGLFDAIERVLRATAACSAAPADD